MILSVGGSLERFLFVKMLHAWVDFETFLAFKVSQAPSYIALII